MSLHIIIDGYNLIRRSRRLKRLDRQDLQLGRDELIEQLAVYKKKRPHRITVVFDGAGAPLFSQPQERIGGIDIKFSGPGESADALIKKIAAGERQKALVVSSDRDVVDFARARGAAVIGARDFEQKISLPAAKTDDDFNPDGGGRAWTPSTKKKGPARRLSKRERKNRLKLGKL